MSTMIIATLTLTSALGAVPECEKLPAVMEAIREGVDFQGKNDQASALRSFEVARNACPSPRSDAFVGGAQAGLGLWVEAEKSLQRALDSTGHDWVEKYRSKIESEIQRVREHLGWLQLTVTPAGADVYVNETLIGRAPVPPLRVVDGTYVVRVSHSGYHEYSRTSRVDAKRRTAEVIELVPRREELRLRDPGPGGGGDPAPPPPPPPTSPPTWPVWVGGSLSVVGLGLGTTCGIIVLENRSEDAAACASASFVAGGVLAGATILYYLLGVAD